MYCPKCGYEYRKEILACPDCGSELVEKRPENRNSDIPDESETYDWINIARLSSWETAEMLVEGLRAKGIPAVVISRSGHFGQFGAIPVAATPSGRGGHLIMVPAEFVSEANLEGEAILGDEWSQARPGDMDE